MLTAENGGLLSFINSGVRPQPDLMLQAGRGTNEALSKASSNFIAGFIQSIQLFFAVVKQPFLRHLLVNEVADSHSQQTDWWMLLWQFVFQKFQCRVPEKTSRAGGLGK